MNPFLSVFLGIFALVFVFGTYQKVRRILRAKKALATGDKQALETPEAENEIGLIIMTVVLYFFLWVWDYGTSRARVGWVVPAMDIWLNCVRVFMALFVLCLLSLLFIRSRVAKHPEAEFAKKFRVDELRIKNLRGSLALFTYFLVFFTIVAMIGVIFLNPEVRALNGIK